MKQMIALVALTFAALQAEATSLNPSTLLRPAFLLQHFELSPRTSLKSRGGIVKAGSIAVNEAAKTLRLTLNPSPYCPPGMFCTLAMPTPIVRDLKIKYVGVSYCGSKIITAENNAHLADGVGLRIQIIDDSTNHCVRNAIARYPVSISVTEIFMQGTVQSMIYGTPVR